ncbi:AAA family ATPase [Candidatus Dependentiae bacterium]|nr:AAA family ATPase [Candidatus Dependentiae bacterium]
MKNLKIIFILSAIVFVVNSTICKPIICVFTGAPKTGKTSVLNRLEQDGYTIFPEAATEIIENDLKKGFENPNKNPAIFQKKIVEKQIEDQYKIANIDEQEIVFLDRSIIDGLAYSKFNKHEPPKELVNNIKRDFFNFVFIFEPLNEYCTDEVRLEKKEELEELFFKLIEAYGEYGYSVIRVPKLTIEDRKTFILDFIKKQG